MVYIHVLRLRQGKYYVGKTTSPISRISNHFDTGGSQWTRKYKPVEIIKVDSDCDDADEDKYTLQYMNKYGINNVRGGTFSTIDLDTTTTTIIKRMLDSQNDNCYRCGKTGHITNQCYAKTCVQEYDGDSEEEIFGGLQAYNATTNWGRIMLWNITVKERGTLTTDTLTLTIICIIVAVNTVLTLIVSNLQRPPHDRHYHTAPNPGALYRRPVAMGAGKEGDVMPDDLIKRVAEKAGWMVSPRDKIHWKPPGGSYYTDLPPWLTSVDAALSVLDKNIRFEAEWRFIENLWSGHLLDYHETSRISPPRYP
ncbi:hypothetical protein LCGC14_2364720 [marine sediment metagenome]|uniref:CCHC-type domain-containing protein n=1 Tax=marine sediment metagenome TaxID=412755 RepID=A0A0F9C5T3_9ZZZZ